MTYCYRVTNDGDVALNLHDLDDDQLGGILSGFNYLLAPGASVFLTQTTSITTTTTNTAVWTAYNAGPIDVATSSDSATVTVLPAEVQVEPSLISSELTVGTAVTHSLTISNTGMGTLNWAISEADAQSNGCDNPGDVSWLATAPDSGSLVSGGTDEIIVTLDATGLAPGSYSAHLCLNSNDPLNETVVVSVDLAVEAELFLPLVIRP